MTAPVETVAEETVLDEEELLGEKCHMVCCKWQTRLGRIMSICGIDVTGGNYREDGVATCAECIEIEHSKPICNTQPWCVEFGGSP